jgi:hypothetical protein
MVMYKKDFEDLAKIFRAHINSCNEEQARQTRLIIDSLIPFLKGQNINFNEVKFKNEIN